MARRIVNSLAKFENNTVKKKISTPPPLPKKSGFYEFMRINLLICRCVGLLPIAGLWNKSFQPRRHSWISLYSLVFFPCVIMHVVIVGFHFYDMAMSFEYKKISALFFASLKMTSSLLLIPYSLGWQKMMKKIELIEMSLPTLRHKNIIGKVINFFSIAVLIGAVFELSSFALYAYSMTSECLCPSSNSNYFQLYMLNIYPWIFDYIPFSGTCAVFIKFFEIQQYFISNFTDILIQSCSIYLVFRFMDFVYILEKKQKELTTGSAKLPWHDLQAYYSTLSRLVQIIDRSLHPFVLVSFIANLSFIAQQLYLILNKVNRHIYIKYNACVSTHNGGYENILYLVVSLIFNIARNTTISVAASRIYTLSRKPLEALHSVPEYAYDYELQRFMDQVYYSQIGISGMGFFHVSRSTLLTVLATLVTYELVLLQF